MKIYTSIASLFFAGCAATLGSTGLVSVQGQDDPLENIISVDTQSYTVERSLTKHFLRGFYSKESKTTAYQLYVTTNSNDWMHWNNARFMIDGELVNVDADKIGSDVACGQYGCAHYEYVGIELTRDQLASWAQNPTTVRISGKVSGADQDIVIDQAEVEAFLLEVSALQ